jgi:hypothetical protein
MNDQQHMENLDETHHGNRGDGATGCNDLDGYSGARARMVFDVSGIHGFERDPVNRDDDKLGFFERTISISMSVGLLICVMASLAVLPFALLGYSIYKPIASLINRWRKN